MPLTDRRSLTDGFYLNPCRHREFAASPSSSPLLAPTGGVCRWSRFCPPRERACCLSPTNPTLSCWVARGRRANNTWILTEMKSMSRSVN